MDLLHDRTRATCQRNWLGLLIQCTELPNRRLHGDDPVDDFGKCAVHCKSVCATSPVYRARRQPAVLNRPLTLFVLFLLVCPFISLCVYVLLFCVCFLSFVFVRCVVCLFVSLCVGVSLFVCLRVCFRVCLFVCLFARLFVRLFVCVFVCNTKQTSQNTLRMENVERTRCRKGS
jgi:hypothetical protein